MIFDDSRFDLTIFDILFTRPTTAGSCHVHCMTARGRDASARAVANSVKSYTVLQIYVKSYC